MDIIEKFIELIQTFGFLVTLSIILTTILVQILKKPIVNYALKLSSTQSVDKCVITKYITYLPCLIMFVFVVLIHLMMNGFNFEILDWALISKESVIYSACSISLYEFISIRIKANCCKE